MLHMVVNTHEAESCAFRNAENRAALTGGFDAMEQAAADNGATVEGTWVNMAAHTIFVLVDAPNAHVVDQVIRAAGVIGWTDSRVYAVESMETAVGAVNAAAEG